ncbi:hypothetical protein BJF78_36020 [Pseudonocardia sp. CNS-139]|nr:hypothetical protein BJF78_36020 [Pseudonocardia sp. CNS-139]
MLRVDLESGGPAEGNPFADAPNPAQQLVWNYGHRNVQGVAVQPGSGAAYSAEHGPTTDDEVNLLQAGATTAGTRRRAARSAATTSRCR